MENKNINNNNSHVEFVSYSGKYPYLCVGILCLKIDGIEYQFGIGSEYSTFWIHGGSYHDDGECCEKGKWKFNIDEIPEQFRKYASEIDHVFNDNVEWGCCGGCR